MSALASQLADYLALRRTLGFRLRGAGTMLKRFVAYLEERGATRITIELALSWATAGPEVLPVTCSQRLSAVRGFAEYLANIDGSTEVPPHGLLPARYSRRSPYLYSDEEILSLMAAARSLRPPLRGLTYEHLIGLLSVSGLRLGEAIALERDDLDYGAALVHVRGAKMNASRDVPLELSTLEALADYEAQRDRTFPEHGVTSLFVSTVATRLDPGCVDKTFRGLVDACQLKTTRGNNPRVHDLRHSFAVSTLTDWYRDGRDVDALMPLLSKVLGHLDPRHTYWYLEASPELLAIVAARIEAVCGERS